MTATQTSDTTMKTHTPDTTPDTASTPGHTPGPWYIDDWVDTPENMSRCILENIGTDNEWVAVGIHDEDGYAASVAYCHPSNAPIVAAAPELLSALKALVSEMDSRFDYEAMSNAEKDAMRMADAAIARATGQEGGQ